MINSAGAYIAQLAGVCVDVMNTLKLPVAINLYVTNQGQSTSAPPHTDKQDVFVLQTSSSKHWRVYAPPSPSRMFRADPFARGKGLDVLSLHELEAPLFDTVLEAGNILYIPAGYPHTTGIRTTIAIVSIVFQLYLLLLLYTDTVHSEVVDGKPSVHLTVGVDMLIWGLTYAGLRSLVLRRAKLKDSIKFINKLPSHLFWGLQVSTHCELRLKVITLGICFPSFFQYVRKHFHSGFSQQPIPQHVHWK